MIIISSQTSILKSWVTFNKEHESKATHLKCNKYWCSLFKHFIPNVSASFMWAGDNRNQNCYLTIFRKSRKSSETVHVEWKPQQKFRLNDFRWVRTTTGNFLAMVSLPYIKISLLLAEKNSLMTSPGRVFQFRKCHLVASTTTTSTEVAILIDVLLQNSSRWHKKSRKSLPNNNIWRSFSV